MSATGFDQRESLEILDQTRGIISTSLIQEHSLDGSPDYAHRLLSKAPRKIEAVTGESSQVHPLVFRHDRYTLWFSPINSTILIFASIRLRNKGAYNSALWCWPEHHAISDKRYMYRYTATRGFAIYGFDSFQDEQRIYKSAYIHFINSLNRSCIYKKHD